MSHLKKVFPKQLLLLLPLVAAMLIIQSCSTKKNTFTRRIYHNLTTHYNVFWNGRESLESGIEDLDKNKKDNYNYILRPNNYGTADEARKIYSKMDRAIEKGTKGIQKHSMHFKNVEYNKWIDDCYLLIGKAQFYKQDYTSAARTFEYVMRTFDDRDISYDAQLWLIKTAVEQKHYEEVLTQFEQLETRITKEKVPFRIKRELPLVYADFFINNKNYSAAKPYLKQGILLTMNGKTKARLNFILGQIYQLEKNYADATIHYTKAIKGAAPYIMAFNARINMAKSFDIATGDKAGLEKQLLKMSREAKNKDYCDLIFYALAELARLENNDTLVMHYLKKSVASSTDNDFQKTTSSLELANMLFNKKVYADARSYYDTTLQSMPKEYPNYDDVSSRTVTLTDLVNNLEIVQFEDSLQRIAKLPEAELNAVIQKVIDEYVRIEKQKEEEEAQRQLEMSMAASMPNMRLDNNQQIGGGGWYFYNPSAISMGYSEFMRKWGRRKLEDNWRLTNKREVLAFDTPEEENQGGIDKIADSANNARTEKDKISSDPKNPESYKQQLPTTPKQLAASNEKIAGALVNLGYIYKDGLDDDEKSVAAFEDLLNRFPDYEGTSRIYFQLYLMGKDIPDATLEETYKNLVLSKFPESEYAMIIKNPEYNNELLAQKNRVISLYQETYQALNRKQYKMVMLYTDEALANYKDKELEPKFLYLRAMAQGNTAGADTMLVTLNKLVTRYPSSDVTPLANELIQKYSKNKKPADQMAVAKKNMTPADSAAKALNPVSANVNSMFGNPNDTVVPAIYKYNDKLSHFYIIMVNEQMIRASALKTRFSDFNQKNFSGSNLAVNAIVLDGGWQMLTVSSFRNKDAAMDYFSTVAGDQYIMGQLTDESGYRHFVISIENYPLFYREKKYGGYLNFFNKYYLQ